MKRCLSASSSSCSSPSSSSSASSSLEFQNHDQTQPSRGRGSNKRARRSVNGNGDGKNEDDKSKKKRKVRGISSSSPAINGGRRSSVYRGVTRHRWTGRFEAHLWDKSCWNNVQNKKGRQVYLGAYDNEEAAARTYDLAALKYWGKDSTLNFPIEMYAKELEEMEKVTKEEYLASLRRQSSGFSRGVSKYRGVARHHHNGRWEARIGRVLGNKYLYLGTYSTQEEAATAYDLAAIQYRGANAVTNFDISRYIDKINLINQNNNNDISQQNQTLSTTPSQIEDAKTTNKISPPNEECSPIIAQVDPTNEHDELPWIFMDDDRFSQFQVPDLPDSDILSVFGDGGHGGRRFDDDIGFLFRPDPEEADFNLDSILSSLSYGDDEYVQEKLMCCANSASCSPNSSISYLDYR